MAMIDSLQTARMFDREKVYTGGDIVDALERVAMTGQYKPAEPASITVIGNSVAYDAEVTGSRFFRGSFSTEKECTCKREVSENATKDHEVDGAAEAFIAAVRLMMDAFDAMNGDDK